LAWFDPNNNSAPPYNSYKAALEVFEEATAAAVRSLVAAAWAQPVTQSCSIRTDDKAALVAD
jgi:hypothetical protein